MELSQEWRFGILIVSPNVNNFKIHIAASFDQMLKIALELGKGPLNNIRIGEVYSLYVYYKESNFLMFGKLQKFRNQQRICQVTCQFTFSAVNPLV